LSADPALCCFLPFEDNLSPSSTVAEIKPQPRAIFATKAQLVFALTENSIRVVKEGRDLFSLDVTKYSPSSMAVSPAGLVAVGGEVCIRISLSEIFPCVLLIVKT
jgi:hypothetical protein